MQARTPNHNRTFLRCDQPQQGGASFRADWEGQTFFEDLPVRLKFETLEPNVGVLE